MLLELMNVIRPVITMLVPTHAAVVMDTPSIVMDSDVMVSEDLTVLYLFISLHGYIVYCRCE